MWGTGVNDANTIPSIFAKDTEINATNFAELGWTAHQSLNELINLYALGHRPDFVIFYDGINEVGNKCRGELGSFSHGMEERISRKIKEAVDPTSFTYYLKTLTTFGGKIKSKLFGGSSDRLWFNCVNDLKKSHEISNQLIMDWFVAKSLVEYYGGVFTPILQPISFLSKTKLDHIADDLEENRAYGENFPTVYPMIKDKMRENNIGYDFTDEFNLDEYIYIDISHVSPNGNAIISSRIREILGQEINMREKL